MADRLHQELLAVPALEQLTQSQLRELAWRTKEQVLIALLQEHASSADAADALRTCARDRKLERRVEKIESVDREEIRKREDVFRADFMQIAANELARLGAPAMITWQKLVFDKDCCAQAFRLMLTRIKSSRRTGATASSSSSSQRALAIAAMQQQQQQSSNESCKHSGVEPEDDGRDALEVVTPPPSSRQRVHFHTKLRARVRTSATPAAADLDDRGGWNFDLSTSACDREPSNNNSSADADATASANERIELPSLAGDSGIRIERRVSAARHHALAQVSSAKRTQLQALQCENAALAAENARLQDEVAHLETLNAALQNDLGASTSPAATLDQRRMQLVEAQNLQLQRQLELLQGAVADMQQVESNLLGALHRWRSVVDAGVQEAAAAGADQSARTESGKSAKWMLAVPDALVAELVCIEAQIHSASAAVSQATEAKLRVRGASSAYLRSGTTSVRAGDVFGGSGGAQPLAHLRLDRVKLLERKLVRLCETLDAFAADALQCSTPRMQLDHRVSCSSRSEMPSAPALASATRALLLEVGALGAVVPIASSPEPVASDDTAASDEQQLTATQVLRVFASSNSGKERERTLKTMLQQLQAQHVAMDNDVRACRREMQYWRAAWHTQEEIVSALMRRVARLGATKMQWCHANVSAPLAQLVHVFESFEHAQLDGSSRQNPFLPALVETLANQLGVLADALRQWRAYAASIDTQLAALVDDYDANRAVLEQQQQ